eukprot:gnl/Dysnectes_brevis/1463_a1657_3923.p1 GENE.gnl/Dysnectes_brevis/1463_a1657_3923~~gnl/Dysnectes_brevis/1463_a1657_3923.p1  ORF type:complete len:328 (+),score=48.67 gnl/Dysnectes_brevis/1463_a1657_3923:36-986(+)
MITSVSINLLSLLFIFSILSSPVFGADPHPVIGILALPELDGSFSFPASYVKWIEAAGARVVPINPNITPTDLSDLLNQISGVLFTGGPDVISLDPINNYTATADAILDHSIDISSRGGSFPVHGTCLGFELLATLISRDDDVLSPVHSSDRALALDFTSLASTSRLYGSQPWSSLLRSVLSTQAVTLNYHSWAVLPEEFDRPEFAMWDMLSTNYDDDGIEFVSSFEHTLYPITATQYHPEKCQFEWSPKEDALTHSHDAVFMSWSLAMAFIDGARGAEQMDEDEVLDMVIYNYDPDFTGAPPENSAFEQTYYFYW